MPFLIASAWEFKPPPFTKTLTLNWPRQLIFSNGESTVFCSSIVGKYFSKGFPLTEKSLPPSLNNLILAVEVFLLPSPFRYFVCFSVSFSSLTFFSVGILVGEEGSTLFFTFVPPLRDSVTKKRP